MGIINQEIRVHVVHSIVHQVRMAHQIRDQHQVLVAISVQEPVGVLVIPRVVATRGFHPHVITAIKKIPAGWRDFFY